MDQTCEFPDKMVPEPEIDAILKEHQTVAVVGMSDKPDRDSFRVGQFLMERGYRITPVNPSVQEILGQKSYASLKEIPHAIEIVCIFRKPDAIPGVVDEAIAKGAKVVWMQLGLAHNAAAKKAEAHGLKVVQNKCMKIELERYLSKRS